ncbi:hypothetical protein [Sulfurimonas sp.]|uniref:hypothetical protein n=1 Tax=Sulfurimonas sp. TaxID=2022749 RepID=UPI00356B078C
MYIILKSNYILKEVISSLSISSLKLLFILSITYFFLGCSVTTVKPNEIEIKIPKTLNLNGENKFPAQPKKVLLYNNSLVIGFDNGVIAKWDLNSSKLTKVFQTTDNYPIKSFFKNENKLFVGSSSMKLSSYSLDSGGRLNEKKFSQGSLMDIIQVKDNLVVAFGNSEILIIKSKNFENMDTKKEHNYLVYTLYYDEKNNILFSGSDDNTIIVWELVDNSLKKISQIKEFDNSVRHILRSPDNIIVTSGNGKIYMFDHSLKDVLVESTFHKSSIVSAKVYNNTLIVGDSSGIVSSWCIANNSMQLNKTLRMSASIRSINFIDDKVLIFSKDGKIITNDLFCKSDSLILSLEK